MNLADQIFSSFVDESVPLKEGFSFESFGDDNDFKILSAAVGDVGGDL
jgi:hypothetical protein